MARLKKMPPKPCIWRVISYMEKKLPSRSGLSFRQIVYSEGFEECLIPVDSDLRKTMNVNLPTDLYQPRLCVSHFTL